jgi:hypothetical protein
MMTELTTKLGFHKDNSTPYYSQANGQVELRPLIEFEDYDPKDGRETQT